MNKSETAQILSTFAEVWSNEPVTPGKVDVYHAVLGVWSFEDMQQAALTYFTRGKFFPRPADLLEIVTAQNTTETPAGDAWELVLKQVRRHGRSGFEDVVFDDPAVMQAVKRVGWRRICDDERPEFVRRDFDAALSSAQAELRRDVQAGQIEAPKLRAIAS